MKVVSWNVNSIRARHDVVVEWLRRHEPDVLCMQETKVLDEDFPTAEFQLLGYGVVLAGQRSYNGVAILSRLPIKDVKIGLVGSSPEDPRRLIGATIGGARVFSAYIPNGKHVESESFAEKLHWLARLRETLEATCSRADAIAVCGDFNVARDDRDVFDPERLRGKLHFHPREHEALEKFLEFGLVDAYRLHHTEGGQFSWWDYRGASLRLNQGLRIDYIFVTQALARRCTSVLIDREVRLLDKPSDHAPVIAEFATPSPEPH